jgi:hypothetical protein
MLFSSIPDHSCHMRWSVCEARYCHVLRGICRVTVHSKNLFSIPTSDWPMASAIGTSARARAKRGKYTDQSCGLVVTTYPMASYGQPLPDALTDVWRIHITGAFDWVSFVH